ncbi:hypothetical protein BGZ60DRAFT_531245 [Tricladium varicosporioides]|nr:hypothetical protein BGZ60DRAFT_531245 [Hymenoscyphus varicosporioides]
MPPQIETYHCICSTLLLATTHVLSSLPRRSTNSGGLDAAIILPLPSSPPDFSLSGNEPGKEQVEIPPEGYTITLGIIKDAKPMIVRREDGFEKRQLWRCERCKIVVGYELTHAAVGAQGGEMDVDGDEGYKGRVMYILPGGLMSTNVMVKMGKEGGRKVGEGDVNIGSGGLPVFE